MTTLARAATTLFTHVTPHAPSPTETRERLRFPPPSPGRARSLSTYLAASTPCTARPAKRRRAAIRRSRRAPTATSRPRRRPGLRDGSTPPCRPVGASRAWLRSASDRPRLRNRCAHAACACGAGCARMRDGTASTAYRSSIMRLIGGACGVRHGGSSKEHRVRTVVHTARI